MVTSINESFIKDILDAIEDVSKIKKSSLFSNGKRDPNSMSVSSLSRASKDLVMSFPVLCDNTIEPRTASMICKAVERKAVTMLQLIFASCSFTNISDGKAVLKQWHTNIDGGDLSLDDYLDLVDKYATESVESLDSKQRQAIRMLEQVVLEEHANGMGHPYRLSSISERSVNDFVVNPNYGNIIVTEARRQQAPPTPPPDDGEIFGPLQFNADPDDLRRREFVHKRRREYEQDYNDQSKFIYQHDRDDVHDKQWGMNYAAQQNRDNYQRGRDAARDAYQHQQDELRNQMDRMKYDLDQKKYAMNVADHEKESMQRMLLDNDIKKCNELVPSLMIVTFRDEVNNEKHFVAGVKARLIGVDSYDIADRVYTKNKDRAGLVNLIRATTKEISFVKDYLLAIDKAKIDAKRNSVKNHSGRIWKTLEKRSTRSVWKRMTGQTNDAAAITTLVISQQLANLIKKEYDIDLANVKTASAIMDSYNLLCLCIVDESMEVARFLFDGDSYYEDLSFTSLERETGDGSYKKVINLLSKMK